MSAAGGFQRPRRIERVIRCSTLTEWHPQGKTERSAITKAEDYLIGYMPISREEYEEEHGKVSDKKWIKVLAKNGFTITPAELEVD
jgi:hypothetical protein